MEIEIKLLKKEMFQDAATVLAKAFKNDKLWSILYPKNTEKKIIEVYKFVFNLYQHNHLLKGLFKSGKLIGVALVEVPNKGYSVLYSYLTFFLLILKNGLKTIKILQYQNEEEKYFEKDCYCLIYLAILPDYQNNGYGKKLLESCLSETQGGPIVLATQEKTNIAFYEKNNFKTYLNTKIKDLETWFMKRG